jgi:uncharacterized protein
VSYVRNFVSAAVCSLLFVLPGFAADEVPVPPLKAHVTDLTNTLSAEAVQSLETKLTGFEASKGSQIAVLIVPTTQPETIEQYGIRVADAWKLGRKGVDDGLIVLVAKEDRTLRIEVGYGLEGVVPDAVAKRVVDEFIAPRFKAGDFAGGIDAGANQLIRLINGEPLPPPQPRKAVNDRGGSGFPFVLFVPVIIAAQIFRSMFGPLGGSVVTAGLGFLGGWLLGGLGIGFVAAVIGFILALSGIGGRGGGWISGGGGGSGGGFGGGGFSGGGGGFGGGGASGRW